jgi:Flp pilus assembly protein TadD
MSTRPRKHPKNEDVNEAAFRVVREATEKHDPEARAKNPAAVALGRLGASKGGKARAAKLSPAKRKAIARKAAQARWRPPAD